MAEVASALRAVGVKFLRMEEWRLEISLQIEKERMEKEMKRTQMLLEAQQLLVEAFLGKQQQHYHHKKGQGDLLGCRSRHGRGLIDQSISTWSNSMLLMYVLQRLSIMSIREALGFKNCGPKDFYTCSLSSMFCVVVPLKIWFKFPTLKTGVTSYANQLL